MHAKLKSIRNNFFSVTIAQIFSLLFNIITFGIAARILSLKDFGEFNYLLAFIGFSAKVIDMGVNPIVFREISKSKETDKYLGSVFFLKSALIILLLLLMNFYLFISDTETTKKILLNLFTINIFFSNKYTNIRELLATPFKAKLKMSIPMALVLLDSILFLLLTLSLKHFEHKLIYFALFYLISNVPSTFALIFLLIKKEKIRFRFDKSKLRFVIISALPIYGYILLSIFFRQIDTLMLGAFNGKKAVAIYNSAIRLSASFVIFSSALTMTFFPLIVRKLENKEKIENLVSSILKLLLVFAVAIALLIIFNSAQIVTIVFGEKYLPSSVPLAILSAGLIFSFSNFFLVDLSTALNKQKNNFIYSVLLVAISVPLYYLFLPKFSYRAAAFIKVFAYFSGFIFLFISVNRKTKIKIGVVKIIGWIVLNSVIFYLFRNINIFISIFAEISILLITLLFLRIFDYSELKLIFGAINKENFLEKIKFLVSK